LLNKQDAAVFKKFAVIPRRIWQTCPWNLEKIAEETMVPMFILHWRVNRCLCNYAVFQLAIRQHLLILNLNWKSILRFDCWAGL